MTINRRQTREIIVGGTGKGQSRSITLVFGEGNRSEVEAVEVADSKQCGNEGGSLPWFEFAGGIRK